MEICQSAMHGRTGGLPSITEMESDMSRRRGGLRGGDQSFFKKRYGARWVGVGGAGKEGKRKGEGEGAGGGRWRGEMRYELKLRRMENEWGWEELDWVQAPFHTEAQ